MSATAAPAKRSTVEVDGYRLCGPEKDGRRWRVTLVDVVLESVEEKWFDSKTHAQAFVDGLVTGHAPVNPLDEATPERRLDKHVVSERPEAAPAPPQLNRSHTRHLDPKVRETKDPEAAKFNIGAVREVLERYRLDPFAEIAEVLQAQRAEPVRDADGKITGTQMVPLIGGMDRAKILVELGQYVAPKLKAVEMKVKDLRELGDDELAKRIAALQAKEAKAAT